MNATVIQAPGSNGVVKLGNRIMLRRRCWTRLLAIAVVTLTSIASAFASSGTLIAQGNLTRPRGAVRVTTPLGSDVWVSDNALGFCRIDAGQINPLTCFAGGTAEVDDARSVPLAQGGGFIYVVDSLARTGVSRLTMKIDPVSQRSVIATTETFASLGLLRPSGVALGPDGKLYLSFLGDNRILRYASPAGALGTQRLELVGAADKTVDTLSFHGNDLWMIQGGFINRMSNAVACFGACQAQLVFGLIQSRFAVIADSRYVYVGAGDAILRYDTTTANTWEIYSQSGIAPGAAIPQAYQFIFGLSRDRVTGEIFMGDDFFIEAVVGAEAGGPAPTAGRLWSVKPPVTTEGLFTTPLGAPIPINSAPGVNLAKTASVLFATGLTQPNGLLFLGTHWWVSDSVKGFCRLDAQGGGSPAAINTNTCYKPTASFQPGNASIKNTLVNGILVTNVFIPDRGAGSSGIWRVPFLTATQTLNSAVAVNLGQSAGQPSAAIIGPDGALYMSFLTSSTINKMFTPESSPILQRLGTAGSGVNSMTFQANDLYLSQVNGIETWIMRASPSLIKGTASPVGNAFINLPRGASPPFNVIDPLSLTSNAGNVYAGGASEVDQWSPLLQKMTVWTRVCGVAGINTNLQNVSAVGFDNKGVLAIGDDPTVDPLTGTTLTPGHGRVCIVALF